MNGWTLDQVRSLTPFEYDVLVDEMNRLAKDPD